MLLGEQLPLWQSYRMSGDGKAELHDAAAAENKMRPVHRWVPWIAGFSAQFVEDAVQTFLPKQSRNRALVLDPFAGVGTTLVEALRAGCNTIGYDINAFAVLAARAKIDCIDVPPDGFKAEVSAFRTAMLRFESEVNRRYAAGGQKALRSILNSLRIAPLRISKVAFLSSAHPLRLSFCMP